LSGNVFQKLLLPNIHSVSLIIMIPVWRGNTCKVDKQLKILRPEVWSCFPHWKCGTINYKAMSSLLRLKPLFSRFPSHFLLLTFYFFTIDSHLSIVPDLRSGMNDRTSGSKFKIKKYPVSPFPFDISP
jgi:hypothetical protein